MTITALSLAVTLLAPQSPPAAPRQPVPPTLRAAAIANGQLDVAVAQPRWMEDAPVERPTALPVLYTIFGGLQVADAYSTRRALKAGAVEANPFMKGAANNTGAMYAVKGASTAAAIYLAEKAWKKNRKGAVILMTVINGVTAAVVARNLRNAR